jgi:NAD(P)-dependent dehydrogenase (short-subunit alcohol dehydrogenase family)
MAARRPEKLEAAVAGLAEDGFDVHAVPANVAEESEIQKVVEAHRERHGRLDVLVNNAGIDRIEPAEDVSGDNLDAVLQINLLGYFHCAQAAGRRMLDRGGGSIINISSIAGQAGIAGLTSYSMSKGGVDQMTRVMAVEWATRGVRVNAIAPGYFENIMVGAGTEHDRPDKQRQVITFTPMARRGHPDELIGPVVFLASDASSYVTGAVLYVDGGYTAA